ncbi:MAG: AAA family ATPase [Nitrospirae bacterium]|nr:AAA family ATPase [Nitrospirota bacterium]
MILKKLQYHEHKDAPHYWEIQDVELGQRNLIVGLNATGKTRLLQAISKLAGFISPVNKFISYSDLSKRPPNLHFLENGYWKVQFYDATEHVIIVYELETVNLVDAVDHSTVKTEKITANGKIILNRSYNKVEIDGMLQNIPFDSLSQLHDPIAEKLIYWAKESLLFHFDHRNQFEKYYQDEQKKENEKAPKMIIIFMELLENNVTKEKLIEDFNYIGYPIDDISIEQLKHQPFFGDTDDIIVVSVKEKGLLGPTAYYRMSQGMFRAFTLIAVIEDLLLRNSECTVVIDDIGEGLDFERSSKLIKLIFNKLKDSNIQFIAATNNRFLINAVDISELNVLEREGHVVKSYNYSNSKERFDHFDFMGLGTFDLFRLQMYKAQE